MAKNKQKNMIIIGVLVLVVLLVGPAIFQANLLTGYGGMTAEITGITDGSQYYKTADYGFADSVRIMGTTAQCDPQQPYIFAADPTGIRMELTSRLQPVDAAAVNLGDVERPIYTDGIETGNERISARIVPMVMGVTVRTFGIGADPIRDIIFTIRIQENDFNMFEGADETIAYMIDVYLIEAIKTTSTQLMQLAPSTGGVSVPSDAIGTNPVPLWVTEGSSLIDYHIPVTHSEVLSYLTVTYAQPSWPLFGARTEQEASWNIGVDVLVFGHWVVEGELPDFQPQDTPDAWDELVLALGDMFGAIGVGLIAIIVIIVLVIIIMLVRIMSKSRSSDSSRPQRRKFLERRAV